MSRSSVAVPLKRMIGIAPAGSRIIWHNDPSGPKEVLITRDFGVRTKHQPGGK